MARWAMAVRTTWARRAGRILAGALLGVLLWGMAAGAAAQGIVTVRGGALLRDGAPWLPKGFTVAGLLAWPGAESVPDAYRRAAAAWGPAELAAARRFGADTLRIQIARAPLDPSGGVAVPAYLDHVAAAVAQARGAGFAVILSLQWEGFASAYHPWGVPDAAAAAVWATLARRFAPDGGVLFELYDEPAVGGANLDHPLWPAWSAAMQPLADAVRATGARNVMIADGMYLGRFLPVGGPPPLRDPLGQLAYAVHPFPEARALPGVAPFDWSDPANWNAYVGRFCATGVPCLVTEWSSARPLACWDAANPTPGGLTTPELARALLEWLKARNIGMAGAWALDMPGTVVTDLGAFTPTHYARDFRCHAQPPQGPGALLAREWWT